MKTATIAQTKTQGKISDKLKWSVPRWSTARGIKKVAPLVFGVGPVLRIITVSISVGATLCVVARFFFPQLPLDFVWKSLIAFPIMFAYVGLFFAISMLCPARVKITKKQISYFTGQSGWAVKLADIESSQLVVFSSEHLHLVIQSKGKVRKVAVAPETDLHLLSSLLGSMEVADKRDAFTAARALVSSAMSQDNTA